MSASTRAWCFLNISTRNNFKVMSSSGLVLEYHLISCTRALALAKGKILLASGEGWKQARLSLQNETSGLVSRRRGDFITVVA